MTIRVVTLNVHGRAPGWRERRSRLVSQMAALNADIVALQELNTWPSQGRWLTAALNEDAERGGLYSFTGARKRGRHGIEGIGVMSRLPALERQTIRLGFGGRVAVRCRVVHGGQALDFYSAHFHHGSGAGDVRLAAAGMLLAEIDARRGVPAIVAGDLNGPPTSRALELLRGRLRSAYAVANGGEPERTVPTDPAYAALVLDYILVSKEFDVVDATLAFTERKAAGQTVSDHYGLAADVRFGRLRV